jgi:uncharacterized repeat protein (TIGR01451 family)
MQLHARTVDDPVRKGGTADCMQSSGTLLTLRSSRCQNPAVLVDPAPRGARAGWMCLAVVLLVLGVPAIARAATIYPNVLGDEGTGTGNCSRSGPTTAGASANTEQCSLRQAIALAESGDVISLAAPAISGTHSLKEELSIAGKEVSVVGDGEAIAVAGKKSRVATVASGGALTLTDVALEGGQATLGSAILNKGTLVLREDAISGNEAPAELGTAGGAIMNEPSAILTVLDSTLSKNKADEGGAIDSKGTLSILNSTIAQNAATSGGGGALLLSGTGAATIANATIAGNSATGAGGNVDVELTSALRIKNSIIAAGEASEGKDCHGSSAVESEGYNLSDATGLRECGLTAAGDREAVTDLQLGSPAANGGATKTIALGAESAAIGAGNPAGCTDQNGQPVTVDQRGSDRPTQCDVGAFQTPAADLSVSVTSPTSAAPSAPITYTVTITNSGPADAQGVRLTDTLPAAATLVSTPGCTGTSTLSCAVGILAAGAHVSLNITMTQAQSGPATNAAAVTSSVRDPDAGNNLASSSTSIESPPAPATPPSVAPATPPSNANTTPPSAGNLIMAFKQKLGSTLSAYFLCKVESCVVTISGKLKVGKKSVPVSLKPVTVKANVKQKLPIKLSKKLRSEIAKALAKHQKVTLTVAASVRYGAFTAKTRPLTSTLEH